MINRLMVKNSVAFGDVELELQSGFNVFSGASGSGKSVFFESLLAIFGIKESNAEVIEADLDICLKDFGIELDEFGLDDFGDSLVLSIIKKEKTRYFLNRYASSKKRLSELVSGFGKHISSKGASELKAENLLRVLDDFVSQKNTLHKTLLSDLCNEFELLLKARIRLDELHEQEKNIQSLKELAEFEIQKISSIDPKEAEYEKLLELKKTLSKKEKIQESVMDAMQALDTIPKIQYTLSLLGKENIVFNEAVFEVKAILEDEQAKLEELDEINAEELLNRIAQLSELNRRYGSIAEALAHLDIQRQKLKDFENLSFNKEQVIKEINILELKCNKLADSIGKNRQENLKDFENQIKLRCEELLLKNPKVSLQYCDLKRTGKEFLDLRLEETPIEALSSGEYNRLRLVMMCLDAKINHSKGILVLDEIDANLSGQESEGVAKVLKTLSKTYQIFAISHQPHMPALADYHYLVSKKDGKSKVKLLDNQGRIEEMARMISGADITKEALEFAKKRLEYNQ
ncbi:AAA family ATPase [Helicobacter sp. 13S00477-4]|uniref:AAA family ATPase n=1 Tax=Helicobacter sp. 13S00477-4 TaxID=1905759 RepID=UPI000BA61C4D|nr:AAA family ATPase [Helicobacter sp. 13S00477-4]PAF52151.1 DNA recombination protein RecN [Helicobacter sp. 13S00477-4]